MPNKTGYYQDGNGYIHMVLGNGTDRIMTLEQINDHQLNKDNLENFDLQKYIQVYYKNYRSK